MKNASIIAVSLLLMLLSACGNTASEETTEMLTEQQTAEETTTEMTAEDVTTEEIVIEDLITDAYSMSHERTMGGETEIYEYAIPKINLGDEKIRNINQDIYDSLHGYMEQAQTAFDRDEYEGLECGGISYEWTVYNNVLSLMIEMNMAPDWTPYNTYITYNIDITRCESLTTSSLLNAYGMTESDYNKKVKEALCSHWWDSYGEIINRPDNEGMLPFAQEQLASTVSENNITAATPYINANGELCIVGTIYALAGADSYDDLINLMTYERSPYYAESIDVTTEEITSEEETTQEAVTDDITEGTIKKKELVGTWEIDAEKTMEVSGVSLWDLFGSGSSYGSSMTFGSDNTFSYYMGIGFGASGTYKIGKHKIKYEGTTYEDSTNEKGTLLIHADSTGITYLVMEFYEYKLYWRKVNN